MNESAIFQPDAPLGSQQSQQSQICPTSFRCFIFLCCFSRAVGRWGWTGDWLGLAGHRSCMPLNLLPRDSRRRPIDIPLRWKAAGGKAGAGATRAPPFPGFGCGLCLGRVPGPKPRVARPGSPPPPPLSQPLHPVLGAIGRLYRFRSCCCWGLTLASPPRPASFWCVQQASSGKFIRHLSDLFQFSAGCFNYSFLDFVNSRNR